MRNNGSGMVCIQQRPVQSDRCRVAENCGVERDSARVSQPGLSSSKTNSDYSTYSDNGIRVTTAIAIARVQVTVN